jgi:hypothetical protein
LSGKGGKYVESLGNRVEPLADYIETLGSRVKLFGNRVKPLVYWSQCLLHGESKPWWGGGCNELM